MKRLNVENINTPKFFNKKFNGSFGLHDMERLYALAKHYKGGVYADVGCMDSIMPALLAEDEKNTVYALDFAGKIIEFLAPRFPKVHYEIANCYLLPFTDESVDYIVAGELIEHLENPHAFIRECHRVLKNGGWLAISTPFEEGVSQGSIGGNQHLWSYNLDDIIELMGNPDEIGYTDDPGGKSILAWKQK